MRRRPRRRTTLRDWLCLFALVVGLLTSAEAGFHFLGELIRPSGKLIRVYAIALEGAIGLTLLAVAAYSWRRQK